MMMSLGYHTVLGFSPIRINAEITTYVQESENQGMTASRDHPPLILAVFSLRVTRITLLSFRSHDFLMR